LRSSVSFGSTIRLDRERLPHFPRGAAAAIGNDVGGHCYSRPFGGYSWPFGGYSWPFGGYSWPFGGGAELSVLPVHVLNDALAAIAARQIEIDVGPLAALLRQKTLEQQIHADGIDRGDAEAVADGAVRRGAAALHEDPLLAAEIDDVPDDEEVAGEIELLDQIELALELPRVPRLDRPVALARARERDLPQKRGHRLASRHGKVGKPIAEIRHRVRQAIRQLA
jgi:hypothetical protein